MKQWVLYVAVVLILSACGTSEPFYRNGPAPDGLPPAETPEFTVYLVGDAGDLRAEDPFISDIQNRIPERDVTKSMLIFLGDNIYHHGLPPERDPDRPEKQKILENQISIGRNQNLRTLFIPGNHDWDDAGEGGFQAVRRQEAYVESYLNAGDSFLPDNGCPGPVDVPLSDQLVLIVIDSQWWIHKFEKGGTNPDGCPVSTRAGFAQALYSLIEENKDRNILLAGHHPIRTNGEHGGYFGWQDHLFPLLNVKDYLYLPLPVIGSVYPLARKAGISRQDTPNKEFGTFSSLLDSIFTAHPRMVYASGHDHNLQYFAIGNLKQVVSGAGSKENYARRGKNADFVHQRRGYARLSYYEDGEVWLEFFAQTDGKDYTHVFQKRIFSKE